MLGKKFVTVRKALGMNQADFAKRLGISGAALSKIENDQTVQPGGSVIEKLTKEFDVNLDWVYRDKGGMFLSQVREEPADYQSSELKSALNDLQRDLRESQKKLIASMEVNTRQKELYEEKVRKILRMVSEGNHDMGELFKIAYLDT